MLTDAYFVTGAGVLAFALMFLTCAAIWLRGLWRFLRFMVRHGRRMALPAQPRGLGSEYEALVRRRR